MKETFQKIFKIRKGNKKPYDYYPLCLYRTFFGFPLVNRTDYKLQRGEPRFVVVTSKKTESKLILLRCNEWLHTHMFENEDESLDYRAVKHVTKYLSPGDRTNE